MIPDAFLGGRARGASSFFFLGSFYIYEKGPVKPVEVTPRFYLLSFSSTSTNGPSEDGCWCWSVVEMQEHGGDHVGHAPSRATGVERRQRQPLLLPHQHLREQQRAGCHQLRAIREQRGHERPWSSHRLVPPSNPVRSSFWPQKAAATTEEEDKDDDVGCYCYGLPPRNRWSGAGFEACVDKFESHSDILQHRV